MAFLLGWNLVEVGLLIASFLVLLILELLNSGTEALFYRIGDESYQMSSRVKDFGSVAVFVAAILILVLLRSVAMNRIE